MEEDEYWSMEEDEYSLTPEQTRDKEIGDKLLAQALEILEQHFDSIQIFGVSSAGKETSWNSTGSGCVFSRYGVTKRFVIKTEESMKEN